jgi:predicted transcriptional regulator
MITYPDHLQCKIGRVIRALRKSIGISRAQMADNLECSVEDIKDYETGDLDITLYRYLMMIEIMPMPDKIKATYDYFSRNPHL